MQIDEITSLLDASKVKLVVCLCHHNADPDALCAAFAFSRLLTRLRPTIQVEVAAAEGLSRLSQSLLRSLPLDLTVNPSIEEADVLVLLDTNTLNQLGNWKTRIEESPSPIILIDHHTPHPETRRIVTLLQDDETASSTCEIVYRFFKQAEVEPTLVEAKALFLGIAYDTRHLTIAPSAALKIVVELIDVGVDSQETLPLLSLPMEYGERIARFKACERVQVTRIGEWLIACSHISSYQASAARALISLGAHVAIVAGQKHGNLQVSLRATSEFHQSSGVHIGRDIAQPLGQFLHGMGGGHSVSAGANGVGDLNACFKRCITLLEQRLK